MSISCAGKVNHITGDSRDHSYPYICTNQLNGHKESRENIHLFQFVRIKGDVTLVLIYLPLKGTAR